MRLQALVSCVLLIMINSSPAQETPKTLTCKSIEKINKEFGPEGLTGKSKWLKLESATPLRNKVFVNLDSETPTIISITPPDKYVKESTTTTFEGTVIHRAGSFGSLLMVKWQNDAGNKVWIASIDLERSSVIVTESYSGLTSSGINVEVYECE